ncbi:UDP-N-acetylmuramate dehydrogenase, partial [Streptococcus suis]
IPGSIGGAVYMNAVAYGGEVAHILDSAQIFTPAGYVETLDKRELRFGYRSSILQENGAIVFSAKFSLRPGNHTFIQQ